MWKSTVLYNPESKKKKKKPTTTIKKTNYSKAQIHLKNTTDTDVSKSKEAQF